MKIINTVKNPLRDICMNRKRKKLTNTTVSIIASNCNGGCILHDLGMRFNSPFENLWMKPKDFIKLLKNMPYYMSCKLDFTSEEGIRYPVGLLDDLRIYFEHYKSESEAKAKWEELTNRINYSNLFVLFSDRDGCTESELRELD